MGPSRPELLGFPHTALLLPRAGWCSWWQRGRSGVCPSRAGRAGGWRRCYPTCTGRSTPTGVAGAGYSSRHQWFCGNLCTPVFQPDQRAPPRASTSATLSQSHVLREQGSRGRAGSCTVWLYPSRGQSRANVHPKAPLTLSITRPE